MKSLNALFVIAAVAAFGGVADAQALYAGVRAGTGIPTGDFSQDATATGNSAYLRGASPGLGYGLDGGIGSPMFGFYASYDRIRFGCSSGQCSTSGKYELTGYAAGVRASVPLLPLLRPWAKAGLTYNELKGSVGTTSVTTGSSPGYEVGAGVDIPIFMGFFSLTPQVRRIRQRLSPNGGSKRDVNYYTFDIGLRVRTPL
jgi:hypothetical protein